MHSYLKCLLIEVWRVFVLLPGPGDAMHLWIGIYAGGIYWGLFTEKDLRSNIGFNGND